MRKSTRGWRIAFLVALTLLVAGGAFFFVPPIPQDPAYHELADTRLRFGIPRIGDVVSNAGFLVVGAWGLAFLMGRKGRHLFADGPYQRLPWLVFFIALIGLGAASAVYHADPDNDSLFWDRIPLAVAFMALTSAFIADRIDARVGVRWFLPLLIGLGVASLIVWRLTEAAGTGDLRLYGLVQFYPLLAVPLMCGLFPGRRTSGRYVFFLLLGYAAAKFTEHFDPEIYALLGGAVSGHSLKHLVAALAAYSMIAMLRRAAARSSSA
jgi:hypothetical protein